MLSSPHAIIWLRSPLGAPLACLADAAVAHTGYRFHSCRYRRAQNEVTELVLRMPLHAAPPFELIQLDSRIEVWIDGRLDTDTQWFVRVPPAVERDGDQRYVVVRAVCALYLLEGRIIAYADDTGQTEKSGPADDLIKEFVGENLGAGATADRNLSAYMLIDDPLGAGATVPKIAPRRNLLMVSQELARASAQGGVPVFFDVLWNGAQCVFRTWAHVRGMDRTSGGATVTLDPGFGTLGDPSFVADHRDEHTVVYTSDAGSLIEVIDSARRNASPFNRREQYASSPAGSDGAEADSALYRGRPRLTLRGTLTASDQMRYGRDVCFGDRVMAAAGDVVAPCALHAVTVTITGGTLRAEVELWSAAGDQADALKQVAGDLDAVKSAGGFSTTPIPHGVPKARASGVIDNGWLSATIPRLDDSHTWTGEQTFEAGITVETLFDRLGRMVVTDRQAAIPNANGTLADATRAINALLVALRAHGLIAP